MTRCHDVNLSVRTKTTDLLGNFEAFPKNLKNKPAITLDLEASDVGLWLKPQCVENFSCFHCGRTKKFGNVVSLGKKLRSLDLNYAIFRILLKFQLRRQFPCTLVTFLDDRPRIVHCPNKLTLRTCRFALVYVSRFLSPSSLARSLSKFHSLDRFVYLLAHF